MQTKNSPPVPSVASVLQPYVDRGWVAGLILLVADRQRILSLEAIGFADIKTRKPMRTDAVLWIASQTKPITAAAAMMLVDEGKLNLDDPVQKYLPEFEKMWVAVEQDDSHVLLQRPVRQPTIRQMLSHTSGMAFTSAMESPTYDTLSLRDRARSYAMTPLQSQPGTKYLYSNMGFNTVGTIIEIISGMPYAQFIDQRLLSPLGMRDTSFWPTKEQLQRLPKAYKPNAEKTALEEMEIAQMRRPYDDRARHPIAGGGLFSTAADCARFCQMIANRGVFEGRRYLSDAALDEMLRKQTSDLPESYGLGFQLYPEGTVGHGGALSTNMSIDMRTGRSMIFLGQHLTYLGEPGEIFTAFKKAIAESSPSAQSV